MDDVKKRRRNNLVLQGTILAVAAIIARIFGFVYKIPLINMMTEEGSGYYGNASTIYAFLLTISTLGFPAAISKLTAEKFAEKKYKEAQAILRASIYLALVIGIVFSSVTWFGADFFANLFGSQKNVYAIKALTPAIFIFAILAVIRGYFQGMNTMMPTAVSQIVEQIFNAVFSLVLGFTLLKKGVEYSAAGGTIGTAIGALSALLLMLLVYKAASSTIIRKRVRTDKHPLERTSMLHYWKLILSIAIPIIIGMSVLTFTAVVDVIMFQRLLIFKGFSEVDATIMNGIYTTKHQPLITLPVTIATAFATAIIPSLTASMVKNDKVGLIEKIQSAFKITLLVSIPSAIGIFVLAKPINTLFFPGGSLELVSNLLQIGAISVIFFGISSVSIGILQGLGKLHVQVFTSIIGLIVKVLLNLLFLIVLDINIYGVVIANVIFALISALLNFYSIKKHISFKTDLHDLLLIPTTSALFMGVVCYIMYYIVGGITSSNLLATVFAIITGMIAYGIILIKLNGLTEKEIIDLPKGVKILKFLKRVRLM